MQEHWLDPARDERHVFPERLLREHPVVGRHSEQVVFKEGEILCLNKKHPSSAYRDEMKVVCRHKAQDEYLLDRVPPVVEQEQGPYRAALEV